MIMPLLLVALVLLVSAALAPAGAQPPPGVELRGRVEQITDNELIVRGEDGRLRFVDTAAMPSAQLGALNPGDDVVITTRGDSPRGPIGHSVRPGTPAPPPR
jgi:hypothetical protein